MSCFDLFEHFLTNYIQGGGGGPIEDDVTGILVRSTETNWAKNSILAVDAGVHLSAVVSIMNTHLPNATRYKQPEGSKATTGTTRRPAQAEYFSPISEVKEGRWGSPIPQLQSDKPKLVMNTGPFKNLLLPCDGAKANALYLLRHFISTYLITHPHLDHLGGFAINTAAFQHTTRPKKLAALPHTIDAVKAHVFNDTIWPNLSDEEGGAGLVSFQRLTEGGNLVLGDGEGRGYIEVCDGLAVKGRSVSHGKCMKQHSHRGSISQEFSFAPSSERRGSRASLPMSPGHRRKSLGESQFGQPEPSVVDSSAFFILDEHSRKEILFFGDVEPDSISLSPRTHHVWADAAPKIVAGLLSAIFIECSYDDSQPDETLFGHLTPRHLVAELCVLADKVISFRNGQSSIGANNSNHPASAPGSDTDLNRKRKREGDRSLRSPKFWATESQRGRTHSPLSRKTRSSVSPGTHHSQSGSFGPEAELMAHHLKYSPLEPRAPRSPMEAVATPSLMDIATSVPLPPSGASEGSSGGAVGEHKALIGVKVVVIHVKDTMKDGPPAAELVLSQLKERVEAAGLGCEVLVARQGESFYL